MVEMVRTYMFVSLYARLLLQFLFQSSHLYSDIKWDDILACKIFNVWKTEADRWANVAGK